MIKNLLAAAAAILLAAACISSQDDVAAGKASVIAAPASPPPAKTKVSAPDSGDLPSEIHISSSVGAVVFRHQMHIKDLGVKCADCHHQINARTLNTPHPDYLKSSWINCTTCHSESGRVKQDVYNCSSCHQTNPMNIADETRSAKVVIHRQCWKCHPVATGEEASKGCEKCHSGRKTS